MRLPVNRTWPLAALLVLAGCGGGGHAQSAPPLAANGPQADYPMVIGAPFTVDGVTWSPADTMNYDTVGYAAIASESGSAHRTLPLPSYVEVTELNGGKTILVRLERRGPMTNANLVELSPAAAAQLGIAGERTPIRMRRVNPPEIERAMLRSGQTAPARMDTPKTLLAVLMRKLEGPKPGLTPLPSALEKPVAASPAPLPSAAPPPRRAPEPVAAKPAVPTPATGSLVIQAGAYGTKDRADAAAAKIGGSVSRSGNLWRVRKGPFATRALAEAELARVRGSGYSDARIQRRD